MSTSQSIKDLGVDGKGTTKSRNSLLQAGLEFTLNLLNPQPERVAPSATFRTWCGTIHTNMPVFEPDNDREIKRIIKYGIDTNRQVRCAGHTHSQSPVVTAQGERAILMRLNDYHCEDPDWPDFFMRGKKGDAVREVVVNASWSFEQLYNKTVPLGYFMETQTAGNGLSIGGVMLNCVHGSTMNAGLLNECVSEIRLIDRNMHVKVYKNEDDLKYVKCSLGLFGVATHFVLRMYRRTNIASDHIKRENFELDRKSIDHVVFAVEDEFPVQEYFWDPYAKKCVVLRWSPVNDPDREPNFKDPNKFDMDEDDQHTEGFSDNSMVNKTILSAPLNLRFSKIAINVGMEMAFKQLDIFVTKDMQGENDMFFVDFGPGCVFMGYFIPLDKDDRNKTVLEVLQATKEVMDQHAAEGEKYKIDCPIEFRFVRGSPNCVFSPLYDPNADAKDVRNNQHYMIIEIICYNGLLDVSFGPDSHNEEYTASFMKFWFRMEQRWKQFKGAKPHYGKFFGIRPRAGTDGKGYRAFSGNETSKIFTPLQKKEMATALAKYDPNGVFRRLFSVNLLAEPQGDGRDERILGGLEGIDSSMDTERYKVKSLYFCCVILPYWFSATIYHILGIIIGLMMFLDFDEFCSPFVPSEFKTEMLMWYGFRLFVAIFSVFFHINIICQRFRDLPGTQVRNFDNGEDAFWAILPLCDVLISAFITATAIMLNTYWAGCDTADPDNSMRDLLRVFEYIGLAILSFVLFFRAQARLRGIYYKTFHYLGNGSLPMQKKWTGKCCGDNAAVRPAQELLEKGVVIG